MKHVVLIDDEATNFTITQAALADTYRLSHVLSAESLFEEIEHLQPDLLLMDVSLTGIDGYQACRELKENPAWTSLPIIFVSGHDKLCERIQGYDAGGDDYITKPFFAEELLRKVDVCLAKADENTSLLKSADEARQTAMSLMSHSGSLGEVLHFLRAMNGFQDLRQLGERLLNFCTNYNLHCVVQMRTDRETLTLSGEGVESPLEVRLISELKDQGAIFDFNARTVFNRDRLSLLVKNMPRDDADRYGQIKDTFSLLVDSCGAKLNSLELQRVSAEQQQLIREVVVDARHTMAELKAEHYQQQLQMAGIVEDVHEQVQYLIPGLSLQEYQEVALTELTSSALSNLLSVQGQGLKTDEEMARVLRRLQRVAEIELPLEQMLSESSVQASAGENSAADIELF